jgi:hypothetical protein
VNWILQNSELDVIWIDPYPIRFPKLGDFRNLLLESVITNKTEENPRLKIVSPRWLPIEPLAGGKFILRAIWRQMFRDFSQFTDTDIKIICARPSQLAEDIINLFPNSEVLLDYLDDFPNFYAGRAKSNLNKKLAFVLERANWIITSSHFLFHKVEKMHNVELVLNAGAQSTPNQSKTLRAPFTFGYIGTVADWFDWQLIDELANQHPESTFNIVGPIFQLPKFKLSKNIKIYGPVSHGQALDIMSRFDVGLIPFRLNDLTNAVDPIKYYEYRSLGCFVISTAFGEMVNHASKDRGVFLLEGNWQPKLRKTLDNLEHAGSTFDSEANTWSTRFSSSRILAEFIGRPI